MEKWRLSSNEVYFGNNSVENQWKLQITITELQHQKFFHLQTPTPSRRNPFHLRTADVDQTFVDLDYITVILFNRWLDISKRVQCRWVNISKRVQWFQTSFSIFQCICDPCSAPVTWNNLVFFLLILEINKPFCMNRFQGSKKEFNLDLLDFFTSIKLWSYLIGIPFIKISRFSKLESRSWPKNFRNSRNEISRLAKNLDIRGNQISRFGKKIAKPRNFLLTKISDIKVISTELKNIKL